MNTGKTYSFMDVTASLAGPAGNIDLGYGSQNSEEGITIAPEGDKNTLTMGADGSGMHSLHAASNGTITVRFLQTSPTNTLLMAMYDTSSLSSLTWGQLSLNVRNSASGDTTIATNGAFKRKPQVAYGNNGAMLEWVFDFVSVQTVLGVY